MTGAADLASYGDFVSTPEYGTVWFPRDVPPDWAPYRDGRWVNVAPWGYTWIDEAPWGFAPFHYGRWTVIGDRWAWIPGRAEARPVYAPALVAFFGGGGELSGAIGWTPLAPDEIYRPTFDADDDYLRRLNAANVRADILQERLADRAEARAPQSWRNARAATLVPPEALARGRPGASGAALRAGGGPCRPTRGATGAAAAAAAGHDLASVSPAAGES